MSIYYEFTTSRLDHRLIEILREEANLEFIFLSWKPTLMFNNLRKRWFIRKKEKKKEKKRH